jgi:hypothetical protein
LRVPSPITTRHDTVPHLATVAFKRKPAARGRRAPHWLSIVGWFYQLPSLVSFAGSVARAVCHLALVAARAPLAALGEAAQNGSMLATIPDWPAGVGQASPSPRCGVRAPPPAFRTVRLTREIQAVFNRPEKPNPCKTTLRSSAVPRRITCETRTSLRQRSAFLDLTVDQTWRHLPSAHVVSSTAEGEPLAKVGRERIEVQIEAITGEERNAERRPGALAGSE